MNLLMILLGLFAGCFSGVIPGLHSNTLQSLFLSMNLPIPSLDSAFFVASMSFSRLAFEAIPSILLFIPDENAVLSILPGHRLALSGNAGIALKIYAASTLFSCMLSVLMIPIVSSLSQQASDFVEPFVPAALIAAIVLILLTEKSRFTKICSFVCIMLSGILGQFAFSLSDPFLPAFTGLFAIPAAMFSLRANDSASIEIQYGQFDLIKFVPCIILGVVLGSIADLFPGMSSASMIALFVSFVISLDSQRFLSIIASISASHLLFSFVYASSIGTARTGAAVAVVNLLGKINNQELYSLAAVALICVSLSSLMLFLAAKRIANAVNRMDSRALNLSLILFLFSLVFLEQGVLGVGVMLVASAIGAIPLLSGAKRISVMGFVILPSLVRSFS